MSADVSETSANISQITRRFALSQNVGQINHRIAGRAFSLMSFEQTLRPSNCKPAWNENINVSFPIPVGLLFPAPDYSYRGYYCRGTFNDNVTLCSTYLDDLPDPTDRSAPHPRYFKNIGSAKLMS